MEVTNLSLPGKLFLVVGPSGSGKGSMIAKLKQRHPHYVFPLSCTTRDPRPGEKPGEVYNYISKDEFVKGIEGGEFLEWAEVHQDHYYGILKGPIFQALEEGKIIIREIDIQGFKSVSKIVPPENLVGVFIYVPDLNELKRRILMRGKLPDEEIEKRLISAQKEIDQSDICKYKIDSIPGEIDRMANDMEAIIAKEM